MSNKIVLVLTFLLGVVGGYLWSIRRSLILQSQLLELNKPPREFTKKDWWENHIPNTRDEYQLILARRNWVRNFFHTFIFPYIDRNAAAMLSSEFLMPLNEKLSELEVEGQLRQHQKMMPTQRIAPGRTDD